MLNLKRIIFIIGIFVVVLFSLAAIAVYLFTPNPQTSQQSLIKEFSLKQTSAVIAGQPVKWSVAVKRSDITSSRYLLLLPKTAKNIKINSQFSISNFQNALTLADRKQLAGMFSLDLTGVNFKQTNTAGLAELKELVFRTAKAINAYFLADLEEAVADVIDQVAEAINPDITETEKAKVVDLSGEMLNGQNFKDENKDKDKEKQEEKKDKKTKDEAATDTAETQEDSAVSETAQTEQGLTPPDGETPAEEASANAETQLSDSESALETVSPSAAEVIAMSDVAITSEEAGKADEYVEVTYETEGPTITEQDTDNGKLVTVSSETEDPAAPLTDILAFTNIPEIYKVGQESKIKIKWQNNEGQVMPFTAFDLDGNGKLDYVEWTVPHLSEQVFEIIFISKAWLLNENREIIEDIYDTVATQDGVFATIPQNNYVRVTFQTELNSTKDITLYIKPTNPGQAARVEVYTENGAELIAEFFDINHEDAYKVLLTNLQTPTDVFDLKITGASVDIDYIVDPAGLNKYWIGVEGGNFSDDTNWSTTSGGTNDTVAPTSSDAVFFDSGGATNATVNATIAVASITIASTYAKTITLSSSVTLTLNALEIGAGSTVIMGANSKLTIAGNGTPLTGAGTLDTATNTPNTVEYTGQGTTNITAATPVSSYNNLTVDPAGFSRNSATTMVSQAGVFPSSVLLDGYGYFGSGYGISPKQIVKIRLSDMAVMGSISSGTNNTYGGFTDGSYVYFLNSASPAKLMKIDPSTFTITSTLTLDSGFNSGRGAVTDGTYAYLGTNTTPARIAKVQLSDMTIVGTLTCDSGHNSIQSGAAIDTVNGFAYYILYTNPGTILKVNLSNLTDAGVLTLAAGQATNNDNVMCATDTVNGFLYCSDTTHDVIKINLSTFTVASVWTDSNPADDFIPNIYLDVANDIGYFAIKGSPFKLAKVQLSTLTTLDTVTANSGEQYPDIAGFLYNGYVYVATYDPAMLVRFNTGNSTPKLGTAAGQTLTVTGDLTIGDGSNAMTLSATTYNPIVNVMGVTTINANATISSNNPAIVTDPSYQLGYLLGSQPVTVSWTTDKLTTSQLEYGPTNSYGFATAETSTASRSVNNSVTVSLSPCQTYHARTISKDSFNNQALSNDFIISTSCASPSSSSPPPQPIQPALTSEDQLTQVMTQETPQVQTSTAYQQISAAVAQIRQQLISIITQLIQMLTLQAEQMSE